MSFTRPLASFAASDLGNFVSQATPTELAIAGGVAAVAATAALVAYAYVEYKEILNEKYLAEVKGVIELFDDKMGKITVPGDPSTEKSLPPMFRLSGEGKNIKAQSLHLTRREIVDIVTEEAPIQDKNLSNYKQKMADILLLFKKYYFRCVPEKNGEVEEKSVKSGVLSYFIQLVNNHCVNFEGFDYDIAYLDGMHAFLVAYAEQGNKNSRRSDSLLPIYSLLEEAKNCLVKHRESLTLKEAITQLSDACRYDANKFLRIMLKTILSSDKWEIVDTALFSDIRQGIVQHRIVSKEVGGIVLDHYPEIQIPEGIFKPWLIKLADYYLQVQDTAADLVKSYASPADIFKLPNLKRLAELKFKINKTSAEQKEMTTIAAEIEQAGKVFATSVNVITQIIDAAPVKTGISFPTGFNGNTNKHAVIDKKNQQLLERISLYANLGILTHELISLELLANTILKDIEHFGDFSELLPHHHRDIFLLLHELHAQTATNLENVKKNIDAIELKKLGNRIGGKELDFFTTLNNQLKFSQERIAKYSEIILALRKNAEKNPGLLKAEIAEAKHKLFEVTEMLANGNGIVLPQRSKKHVEEEKNTSAPVATIARSGSPEEKEQPGEASADEKEKEKEREKERELHQHHEEKREDEAVEVVTGTETETDTHLTKHNLPPDTIKLVDVETQTDPDPALVISHPLEDKKKPENLENSEKSSVPDEKHEEVLESVDLEEKERANAHGFLSKIQNRIQDMSANAGMSIKERENIKRYRAMFIMLEKMVPHAHNMEDDKKDSKHREKGNVVERSVVIVCEKMLEFLNGERDEEAYKSFLLVVEEAFAKKPSDKSSFVANPSKEKRSTLDYHTNLVKRVIGSRLIKTGTRNEVNEFLNLCKTIIYNSTPRLT